MIKITTEICDQNGDCKITVDGDIKTEWTASGPFTMVVDGGLMLLFRGGPYGIESQVIHFGRFSFAKHRWGSGEALTIGEHDRPIQWCVCGSGMQESVSLSDECLQGLMDDLTEGRPEHAN